MKPSAYISDRNKTNLDSSPKKIGFLHYFFDDRSAGVNRVIENNIKGLQERYSIEPVFIGGSFQNDVFPNYEKRRVDIDYRNYFRDSKSRKIVSELHKKTKDLDGIVIENGLRGINSMFTKSLRNFSNKSDKPIVYRNHDFISDYPNDWKKFLKDFNSIQEIFPENEKVIQTALTSSTKYKIGTYFDEDISILRNSVSCEEFYINENNRGKQLRNVFENLGIVDPLQKIISYPVRVVDRKNVEEAFLLTKILNESTGNNYKLIVTTSIDKDFKNPKDNLYQRTLEELAKAHEVPCSMGEVSSILDGNNFTVGDLYSISDLAISTSVQEGFGYCFVEPWVSDTPLIGRRIREVNEDFEKSGMKFEHLYDSSDLEDGKNWKRRVKAIDKILSDQTMTKIVANRLKLDEKIDYAKKVVSHNKEVVEKKYNHVAVAEELARMLNL